MILKELFTQSEQGFEQQKNYNAEEFKKFLLACIWDKKFSKNEILIMNLAQNIRTLRQAIEDEHIPLK